MIRIALSKRVLFSGQFLYRRRQFLEAFPKTPMRRASRQVLKPASANIFPHFVENRPQPPAVGKVSVNLLVPCGVFTLADERCKFCQLAGGKRLNSIFDISKTHSSKLAKQLLERKSPPH